MSRLPFWRRLFLRNPAGLVGIVLVVVVTAAVVLAPVFTRYDPVANNLTQRLKPPSARHPFGTDTFGRDLFTRVLYGGRVSLAVGMISTLLGAASGVVLGLVAGYEGARLDDAIMRIMDVLLAFPLLLLAMAIIAALGPSLGNTMIAIGVSVMPRFARLVRSSALSIKGKEYVDAARAAGVGLGRILFAHVLPNCLGPIVVMTTLWIPNAIMTEASLSFLGLGIAAPQPTWGNIVSEGKQVLLHAPWVSLSAGVAMTLTVFAFNLVGDAVRDTLDPRLRGT